MTTGECIRKIRHEKKMTQKQLAERCGIADSAVRKYESGKVQPKVATIRKIADALDVHWTLLAGDNMYSLENLTLKTLESMDNALVTFESTNSILYFLRKIYGDVQRQIARCGEQEYTFYVVGKGGDIFFLSPQNISALAQFVEQALPAVVDQLKYIGTQEQFAENYVKSQILAGNTAINTLADD